MNLSPTLGRPVARRRRPERTAMPRTLARARTVARRPLIRALVGAALAVPLALAGPAVLPAGAAPGVPDIGPDSAPGFGVQCVQAMYYSTGFGTHYPDGVYGPETTADTRRLEHLLGLPEDGVVDPIVGEVLYLVMEVGSGPGSWRTIGCWDVVPSLH
ncbi:peptidoglycan-binding domain-containing protein [Embleya hyalina]|uniref:peptidoglycan-binding domain-containing protein n=1 Tax=Embleya hyalina TaxID=516124 RepID=UPI000F83063D|nr:peptidoglycan-binding domain-containing protein [Embleya hyalina]